MMDWASGWLGRGRGTMNWSAACWSGGSHAGDGEEEEERLGNDANGEIAVASAAASSVALGLVEKTSNRLWPGWSWAWKVAAKSWSSWSSRPRSRSRGKKKSRY